jgi:hypothetical protein
MALGHPLVAEHQLAIAPGADDDGSLAQGKRAALIGTFEDDDLAARGLGAAELDAIAGGDGLSVALRFGLGHGVFLDTIAVADSGVFDIGRPANANREPQQGSG